METVVLDTNIIIHHLSGKQVLSFSDFSVTISSLTVFELLQYPLLTEEEEHNIKAIVQECIIMPVTQPIAEQAASLARNYHTPEIDALIAATALTLDGILITKNTKDFRNIINLKIRETI